MITANRKRDPGRVVLTLFTSVATVFCVMLLGAASANALEVKSSAVDHLLSADIQVQLSADDTTGTVMLLVDGTVVGALPATPGQTVDFGKISPSVGSHQVRADLRGMQEATPSRLSSAKTIRIWDKPSAASLIRPSQYAAYRASTAVSVGLGTTTLQMRVNGAVAHTRMVREGTLASMSTLTLAPGVNTIELVASNPVATTTSKFSIRRLDFPWPTCIIIDKSEFKLYWVKDGVLVKTYPIAIGKAHTPTPERIWRIDAKYYSSGVYGPRKMRLFRQTSSGYSYTAYALHGTNQEWVIGTMASHGCVRMYNKDVLELFPQVPLGTMVQTRR